MKIIKINSPNFSRKIRKNKDIKYIILHYTGMQSKRASIKRLTSKNSRVSCHYFVDRLGSVIQMVDNELIAWHAGKSKWKKSNNLNANSIGIELENKGHKFGYQKYSNIQIKNLIKLCLNLKKKFKIKNKNILGHSDIAPLRKVDPGEKFPWKYLSKKNLGTWYVNKKIILKRNEKKYVRDVFFENLFKIGYRYFSRRNVSKNDKKIIKAFQSRFRQNNIAGLIDQKTLEISHFLAKK